MWVEKNVFTLLNVPVTIHWCAVCNAGHRCVMAMCVMCVSMSCVSFSLLRIMFHHCRAPRSHRPMLEDHVEKKRTGCLFLDDLGYVCTDLS